VGFRGVLFLVKRQVLYYGTVIDRTEVFYVRND
jgi:hypothetical protein